jgi:hypothetical protein
MDSYASIYPGVDHMPTRLPRFDRYGHAWCLVCGCKNGRAIAGDGMCDDCRSRSHADRAPIRARYGHGAYPYVCRCGQHAVALEAAAPRVCGACRDLARAPQGETVRLFTPAPAQLPGQLNL